ncbi:hypothetical protein B0I31_10275 [Saccharothrix carnea]|uniref:Uncharacterized protein n=1 Tax=Saccharothrix carnea TaxID=1280637 RepID=A0A2P8IF47_SACCR|nr:hypothetical protein [Saccharothrix carnea]PSL57098.1 hypothetical protein B0I31_10275 [Saccharothrix carnea]
MTEKGWPNPSSAENTASFSGSGTGRRGPAERVEPLGTEELHSRQRAFPKDPEVEYERSAIRIPFYLRGAQPEGRDLDVMVFDAFMRLEREAPTTNGLGYRQFEFTIATWELNNTYSMGLGADITFSLSDTVQPKSLCVAQRRESDYPALIVYSAIYDVFLGSKKIVSNQPGVAYASPVWEIPPRNVTVAFEKPFSSDLFAFSAGTCEGMRSIGREEFEEGVRVARATRAQAQ